MPSFDPERHARPLSIAGTLAVVVGLYSGANIGGAVALIGVALLLTACYSRQDGFLLFGPFARVDAVRQARRRRTHVVRAGVALAAGAVIVFNGYNTLPDYYRNPLSLTRQTAYVNGQIINWFAISIAILVPLLTTLLVSGAIAEERAAKRWEVLLTTDLRGRELVFGKLLGKLWLAVEPVVVIVPVLAILPLIVGVPVSLMLHFGGAVAVTVLALAGVSALAASRRSSQSGTVGVTLSVVGLYLILSFGVYYAVARQTVATGAYLWSYPRSVGVATPVVVSDLVAVVNFANPVTIYLFEAATIPAPFGSSTPSLGGALRQYSTVALGVFLVGTLLACQRVRSARDPELAWGVGARRFRLFAQGKSRESVRERAAKLRPPVTDEPLTWWANCRLGIYRSKPTKWRKLARNFAVMVAGFLGVYAVDIAGRDTVYPLLTRNWQANHWPLSGLLADFLASALPALLLIFAVILPVVAATQSIAKERSGDTLEPLRLTPLTAREMLEQVRNGCVLTSRLSLWLWSIPAAAAAVTGYYRPLTAGVLATIALAGTPPLVNFALYCSAWASTPTRAMRNIIFGGLVWHYALFFAGAATFFGVLFLFEMDFDESVTFEKIVSYRTAPEEFFSPVGTEWGKRTRTFGGDLATIGMTAVILGLYFLAGRWVFDRAVGRFAKSRDATD